MSTIKAELDAAPSLEPYEYKAWDGDARDFVNGILRQYLNPGSSMDTVTSKPKAAPVKAKVAAAVATEATNTNPSPTPVASAEDGDDLDSFLNDLDI